jgi:predicted transcriptional regulator
VSASEHFRLKPDNFTRFRSTTEVFVSHTNARLTVHGSRLPVDRARAGRSIAHVADGMGISRTTARKWVRRWRADGDAGLRDRKAFASSP